MSWPQPPMVSLLALLLTLMSLVGGCSDAPDTPVDLVVGEGSTIEARVLAAVARLALEDAGLRVGIAPDLGDTVSLRRALLNEQIDLYWDYSGAAWSLALGLPAPPTDPEESYAAVAAEDADNGLRWLAPTDANATLGLFVGPADWPGEESATLSWLAGQLSSGVGPLCADPDFLASPTGYQALADAYAISVASVVTVGAGEAKALEDTANGACLAALATTTSGLAQRAGLRAVRDDQQIFPAFVPAPVVRQGSRADTDTVAAAMAAVAHRLTTEGLAALNARVRDGEDPLDVARAFLDPDADG